MSDRLLNPLSTWLEWTQSLMEIWWGKPPMSIRRAQAADAAQCAKIHAESFAHPWSALTFEQMLTDRSVHAHVVGGSLIYGFIVTRVVVDEAEVLSIAVGSNARRAGLGNRLLEANINDLIRERITAIFLEVEAGNSAAIALYRKAGFTEIGRRKGYYREKGGAKDAMTMRLDLSRRPPRPPVLDV